ncbi:MAG TPA: mechanosensitive ion channel family protein [Spirochaetota bacterium]|nr:mechanosensitive ion channel family protein [Spirochaetota bacterium]
MDWISANMLGYSIFGNSILNIAISIGLIIIGIITVTGIKRYVKKKAARLIETDGTSIFLTLFRIQNYTTPFLYVIIIFLSLNNVLTFSQQTGKKIYIVFVIALSIFGLRLFSRLVNNALKTYLQNKDKEKSEDQIQQSIKGISTFINIAIWAIGSVFIIDNIGFNISAIVAGLGIGGVAVALASQAIFRDLFSYFVIFFDQPFKIGDFIVIEDKMGTIEKIGIKTTRIKSLNGEEIILSNTDLTNSRVHNYKNMDKRRVVLTIGVVYQTQPKQVDAIPGIIRKIIDSTDGVLFDRSNFKEFGDSGLIFETVYFIESSDYNYYMEKQHEINLQVLKKFNRFKIGFAYPTRTLYMEPK